jgi:hypothetical protein
LLNNYEDNNKIIICQALLYSPPPPFFLEARPFKHWYPDSFRLVDGAVVHCVLYNYINPGMACPHNKISKLSEGLRRLRRPAQRGTPGQLSQGVRLAAGGRRGPPDWAQPGTEGHEGA